jgi:hypothetical protein
VWKDGSELVILESPTPEGPFSFVASQEYFGPSNGYDPALPVNWMSSQGTDLWMIWAANFTGCSTGLDCSGAYGFNYAQLHLTTAKPGRSTNTLATLQPGRPRRRPRPDHRRVYATPPRQLRARWANDRLELI